MYVLKLYFLTKAKGTEFMFGSGNKLIYFIEVVLVNLNIIEEIEIEILGVRLATELDLFTLAGTHYISYRNSINLTIIGSLKL